MSIALEAMVHQLIKRVEALELALAAAAMVRPDSNATRHAEGMRLRKAIADIFAAHPEYSAKQVLKALSPANLARMPSVRAVQWHITKIRNDGA